MTLLFWLFLSSPQIAHFAWSRMGVADALKIINTVLLGHVYESNEPSYFLGAFRNTNKIKLYKPRLDIEMNPVWRVGCDPKRSKAER